MSGFMGSSAGRAKNSVRNGCAAPVVFVVSGGRRRRTGTVFEAAPGGAEPNLAKSWSEPVRMSHGHPANTSQVCCQ